MSNFMHSTADWFKQTRDKLFTTFKLKRSEDSKKKGRAKEFLSKLSGAFLLPISVLAIAGLFLGIGSTISGQAGDNSALRDFGLFIKNLGQPVFSAMPLLFAAAVAISFTQEAGVSVFATIIGYMTFILIQSTFIKPVNDANNQLIGYTVLFGGGLRDAESLKSLVGDDLGIKALQTSVFGGIIVGLVVQWTYLKFHTIQLPQIISFFGGKRFVSLMAIVFMIPLAFAFLILWPYIGYAFNWFGENSGKIPYGFDSFIFGYIERILVPFGLHHVFYSPLWYTGAGGNVSTALDSWLAQGNTIADSSKITAEAIKTALENGNIAGDSVSTVALIGVSGNTVTFTRSGVQGEVTLPLFEFVSKELGINLGRFLQGKFAFMQWGLPFAGLAMVLAAPKENRKVALGIVFPAAVTCFVTGVTEPLEFTFLFLAPILFFGFHAFMCALSFMLMNLFGAHVGMTFSGGFLDLMIYGAIPFAKGTNFWWSFVIGAFYAPIYFSVFYFWIKKFDLPTPGRGGNTKLFTKKDYQNQKNNNEMESEFNQSKSANQKALDIIEGFGGKDNIVKTNNCASRLRFDVKDASLVSEDKLKEAGAFGIRKTSDTHVQVIFGPIAESLRVSIDNELKKL